MNIKKLSTKNSYKIVVDNESINNLYGYSNEKPLVLAHLYSHNPQEWKLQDCRLFKAGLPQPKLYLENTIYEFKTDNTKKLDLVIALADLKNYQITENSVVWSTMDGIVFNENTPKERIESFFSFKEGQEKLNKLANFWKNYFSDKIEPVENKYLQPNKEVLFMINFLIKEFEHNNTNEQLIKSVDQLSAIVDNYKKEYWKRTKIPIADDTLNLLIKYFENPNTINNPTKKLKF
jgi:hypothetical protein